MERLNNPQRLEEEQDHRKMLQQYKDQVENDIYRQTKDVEREIGLMEKEWRVVD